MTFHAQSSTLHHWLSRKSKEVNGFIEHDFMITTHKRRAKKTPTTSPTQ